MPYCVVKGCPHTSSLHNKSTNSNISFHVFPKDPVSRDKWQKVIQSNKGKDTWKASNSSVICSAHFEPNQLSYSDKGLRRIAKNAVPTQNISFTPPSGPEYEPTGIGIQIETPEVAVKKKVSGIKIELAEDYPEPVDPMCLLELSQHEDDNDMPLDLGMQDEDLKDSDSELPCPSDTPQVANLKKKLKRLQHWRKTASRKLKNLHQNIRRLEKKSKILKEFREKHDTCKCKYCKPGMGKQKKDCQPKNGKTTHTENSDDDNELLSNLKSK